MEATSRPDGEAASANITRRIQELGDWRGETLARVRRLIHDADPDIQEEWKWVKKSSPGTPVWSHDGGVCTGEPYKQVVKLTFFRGASLEDPEKLFNSSLEGNTWRAIDLREGEKIDEAAFKQLIRTAVAANTTASAQRAVKKMGAERFLAECMWNEEAHRHLGNRRRPKSHPPTKRLDAYASCVSRTTPYQAEPE